MSNFKFMDPWPAWTRWIAVVPASLLGLALVAATYALYLTIYYHGTKPEGFPPFSIVAPFAWSALAVWLGVATAPRSKVLVALILSGYCLSWAYHDFTIAPVGSHHVAPAATDVISYMHQGAIALVCGVIIAWAVMLLGHGRLRLHSASV